VLGLCLDGGAERPHVHHTQGGHTPLTPGTHTSHCPHLTCHNNLIISSIVYIYTLVNCVISSTRQCRMAHPWPSPSAQDTLSCCRGASCGFSHGCNGGQLSGTTLSLPALPLPLTQAQYMYPSLYVHLRYRPLRCSALKLISHTPSLSTCTTKKARGVGSRATAW
jgi:hypothetical protein